MGQKEEMTALEKKYVKLVTGLSVKLSMVFSNSMTNTFGSVIQAFGPKLATVTLQVIHS